MSHNFVQSASLPQTTYLHTWSSWVTWKIWSQFILARHKKVFSNKRDFKIEDVDYVDDVDDVDDIDDVDNVDHVDDIDVIDNIDNVENYNKMQCNVCIVMNAT